MNSIDSTFGLDASADLLEMQTRSGKVPQPGRAHLLPLMRTRITNDSLAFFTGKLVPMSERSFERKIKAEEGGRAGEAKVWEVIIGQIWDCLPGFIDLARDLRDVSWCGSYCCGSSSL